MNTVMPKAIAHPNDYKMLQTARPKLVEAAKGAGIELKSNLIVGARSFDGNPYDGHTLYKQIVKEVKQLARCHAVEPIIGYLK